MVITKKVNIESLKPLKVLGGATWVFEKKNAKLLLKYAKRRHLTFKWEELTDPMDKAWFCTMIQIIRNIEGMIPAFMDDNPLVTVCFSYNELAVLERGLKIFQIEIGEENQDQKFFQWMNSVLFKIL